MQMWTPAFNTPPLASTEKQLLKHKTVILCPEHLALIFIWSVTCLLLSVSPLILSSRSLLAREHCVPAKVGNGRFSMLSENTVLTALWLLRASEMFTWALLRQRGMVPPSALPSNRSTPSAKFQNGLERKYSFWGISRRQSCSHSVILLLNSESHTKMRE